MTTQQIQIYTSADGQAQLEVALEQETVWLSQAQMAELFGKDIRTINEHIGNVFAESELEKGATIRKFRIVRLEGNRQVQREIDHFNLDVIISVGYRVKSQRGVQFRKWATTTLKNHLVQGYTLNQQRLVERGVEFGQVVNLLSRTLTNQGLASNEGQAVARVISDYARSWSLLQGYDEQQLAEVGVKQPDMQSIELDEALEAVGKLKQTLIAKNEATELFAQVRGDGLASAMNCFIRTLLPERHICCIL